MIANRQIQKYFSKMAHIQELLLEYLDTDTNNKDDFDRFYENVSNISKNKEEFKSFLYLISKISDNHYRNQYFIAKIEQILTKFKEYIKNNFSESKIFSLFKKNKLIILFLHEQKIITLTEKLIESMPEKYKFSDFFKPEIGKCSDSFQKYLKYFKQSRKIGENEDDLCTLIRVDSINKFISFVNKKKSYF